VEGEAELHAVGSIHREPGFFDINGTEGLLAFDARVVEVLLGVGPAIELGRFVDNNGRASRGVYSLDLEGNGTTVRNVTVTKGVGVVELKFMKSVTLSRRDLLKECGSGDLAGKTREQTAIAVVGVRNPGHGLLVGPGLPSRQRAGFSVDVKAAVLGTMLLVVANTGSSGGKLGVSGLEIVKVEEVEVFSEAFAAAHAVLVEAMFADVLVSVFLVVVMLDVDHVLVNTNVGIDARADLRDRSGRDRLETFNAFVSDIEFATQLLVLRFKGVHVIAGSNRSVQNGLAVCDVLLGTRDLRFGVVNELVAVEVLVAVEPVTSAVEGVRLPVTPISMITQGGTEQSLGALQAFLGLLRQYPGSRNGLSRTSSSPGLHKLEIDFRGDFWPPGCQDWCRNALLPR